MLGVRTRATDSLVGLGLSQVPGPAVQSLDGMTSISRTNGATVPPLAHEPFDEEAGTLPVRIAVLVEFEHGPHLRLSTDSTRDRPVPEVVSITSRWQAIELEFEGILSDCPAPLPSTSHTGADHSERLL